MSGLGLRCVSRRCKRVVEVTASTVIVRLSGSPSRFDPTHEISWTCPSCLWPCRQVVSAVLGADMLESGAVAHVPVIEQVIIDGQGVVTMVAHTVNDTRHPCTLVQHGAGIRTGPADDLLGVRWCFADYDEAKRWVASQLHPAGGAA